jgi:tetratricopeptide (TPR) repeat protein
MWTTCARNGVYVKESERQNVRTHGNATYRAWLWMYGNDGEIYWIDPTWTDNYGYVVWAIARDGEGVQLNSLAPLDVVQVNLEKKGFTEFNRDNANKNNQDSGKALEDSDAAIRNGFGNAAVYIPSQSAAYYGPKDYDKAIAGYTHAIRPDRNNAIAYTQRGEVYCHNGNCDRSIADYNKAIELDPNDAVMYNNRDNAYFYKGDRACSQAD